MALVAAAAAAYLTLVFGALVHVGAARSLLEEERAQLRAEIEAFGAFQRRIAEMDAAGGGRREHGATTVFDATASGVPPEEIERAYRETVMSVPHYETGYDEHLARNMAVEFGDDVANAVVDGADLAPYLKGTLLERSRAARSRRSELLEQLDEEAGALARVEPELTRIERSTARLEGASLAEYSFDQLAAEWYLLEDRERDCRSIVADRQRVIQDRRYGDGVRSDVPDFEAYLYGGLDVRYPVLAETTGLLERVRRIRRQVSRAIAFSRRA